jgi:hypothetical protein
MPSSLFKLYPKLLAFLVLGVVLMPISVSAQGISQTAISLEIKAPRVCLLNLKVYPEKRIPRTGNWGTLVTVEIYNIFNQFQGTMQARSNNAGDVTFNACANNIILEPGIYNFYVRGLSHLRKSFPLQQAFDSDDTISDLTTGGRVLLAGETSNIFDNKINSLDASTQVRAFYKTDDEKNDLNRDGKVNSLDFSNTVYNFYRTGD